MVVRTEKLPLTSAEDIVKVRQAVRAWALELKFSLVDQTKMVTAASELARNTVIHGGGGGAELERLEANGRRGLRLTFSDHGPGIVDIAQAMKDGFTTGSGLGLGLGGAKRLVNEFEIQSQPGVGTVVRITRWA
jgi:serine/threonine-protein kinase RsbT